MKKNVYASILLLLFIFFKINSGYGQNPSNISGLKLWLKADTGIILNGSNVSGWNDQSGNANDATQSIAGSQPLLVPNILNNLPAVRFNGSKILNGKEIPLLASASLTVFVVASGGPMSDAYNVLFDIGPYAPGGLWLCKNSEKYTIYANNAIYGSASATLPNAGFEPTIFGYRKQLGVIAETYLNTAVDASSSAGSFTNAFANGVYNVGGDASYSGLWTGDVFEIIVFDKALNNTEFTLVNNYLIQKYTPLLDLGADKIVNPAPGCVPSAPVTLQANPDFKTYLWSTGETVNQITVNQYGTYSVTTTDIFGTQHSDTITIAPPVKNFNYPSAGILCENATLTWDTELSKKENTFKWQDNSTDSLFKITQAGNYFVTVTDTFGCAATSKTISIVVDNFPSSISLGNDTSFCSGNPIYLKKGAVQVLSYLWSTGSTDDSLVITASGKYWLTVKNANNCTVTDTINVVISGSGPLGNFSFANTCIKNATAFMDLSIAPAGETLTSWSWDFGDGSSSVQTNPVHTYADTGSYTVKLTVKASNGCEVGVSKSLKVYPKPIADFTESVMSCDNTSLRYNGTATTYGYPIISWKWKFFDPSSGANDSSALQNPVHRYATFATYLTQLIVTTGMGCKDTVVKSVSIQSPQASPQLLYPQNNHNAAADSLRLSWSQACGSSYYELNIAEDINFSTNNKLYKVYSLNADTVLKKLIACKTYYWRVRAFAPVATPFSPSRSFSIFSPACLPDLELWLDASSGVSVDGSGQVNVWSDKSGKNKNAIQHNPNLRPLFFKESSSTSNKSAFVRLDGNDLMDIDSSAKIGSFFSVFNWRGALPNFPDYNAVFMTKAYTPRGFVLMGISGQTNYYIDGTFNTFSNTEVEVNRVNKQNMAPLDHLKMVNGITSLPVNLKAFYLGHFASGNTFWNGDIGDIIIYGSALAAPQKAMIQDYLNDKYAPRVNLGADQTVCSFPLTLSVKKNYFTTYLWSNASVADSLVVNSPGTYFVKTTDVFGRISSDTIVIVQSLTDHMVNLGKNDTTICQGQSLRLTAGPPHLTYLWSTGSTTNAIDVTQTGSYSVAVTDCQGNISRDTIKVLVRPLPVFELGKDTLYCNLNSIIDPGFLDSKNLIFNWSDNTHDSIKMVNATGIYGLTVIDPYGCSFSDTIKITVDSLKYLVTLGPDTTFCAGNAITLKNGASKAVDYLWSTGSNNDSLSISTSGNYWVQVKSIHNCIASDTIVVTISGNAPTANFKFQNSCFNNVTQFADSSVPFPGDIINSWQWDFGDMKTSTLQNPFHTYPDTGVFTVRLTVGTQSGCYGSILRTVNIYPLPKPEFTYTGLCEDVRMQFNGQVTTYGYPVNQWSWNFGDPGSGGANTSTLQNPAHVFANGGTYRVKLQVTNVMGCVDTISKNVAINIAPVADFSFSLACKDDPVAFKDMTILPPGSTNIGNYWNFGNSTSLAQDPVHTFAANVKYNVMHVVTASNGCKDTVVKAVDVHASPTALFTNSPGCELNVTPFTDLSIITIGSITGWKWTFENTSFSTVKNPEHVFKKTGNATAKLLVTSDFGCKDSLTKTIVVYPKPVAQFTVSPEYGNPGQLFKFSNTTVGASSYVWNFDDGFSSTLPNPSHTYADTGSFDPYLIAKSTMGCLDTSYQKVQILKRYIDVGITAASAQVVNGGGVLLNDYLNVSLSLKNKSTADIAILEFYLETNDGPAIKETWTGKFLKGASMEYDFKATPTLKTGDHFICVYALNPNGLKDELPIDNKLCKALDESAFKVLDPYPNPTSDMLEIPLVIPSSGDLKVIIYDSKGDEVEEAFDGKVGKGLQLITIETRKFNSGLYLCKLQLQDQVLFTKFIRK